MPIFDRDGREVVRILDNQGREIETVYDQNGVIVYTNVVTIIGTSPMQFKALGLPLKDYRIYGETLQDGTPSPDMPVDVVGCGARTENLWDGNVPQYDYVKDYKKYNPDNAISLKAGTYTVSSNGKLPIIQVFDNSYTQLSISDVITISSSYFITWDGFALAPSTDVVNSGTITLLSDCVLTFAVSGALPTYIMLNTGSAALPYEPYGYKLPVTTTNGTDTVSTPIYIGSEPLHRIGEYADYVDYSSGKIMRRIKKLVLTGKEIILRDREREGSWRFFTDKLIFAKCSAAICSHFENIGTDGVNNSDNIGFSIFNKEQFGCRFPKSIAGTAADFKAYLAAQYAAGTPVKVWYVLQEPIEEDPPVPFQEFTTLSGTNTLTVDTTVKPSEIDLTGRIKTSGYGQLLDKNSTAINDSTGTPIFIRG